MNNSQFVDIVSKYTHDVVYWSPEILGQKYYYLDDTEEDVVAIIILHQNRDAFKARILGTIKDNWLNKELFSPIAQRCIDVLENLNDLEDWQLNLIDIFKSYLSN